jgi:DNA-binding transcriptional MerR regulator
VSETGKEASQGGQMLFKLSQAAEKLGLEKHVLRYWEKEFSRHIKPVNIGPRKRFYSLGDLDTFSEIRRLLYEERFTVEGAKKRLAQTNKAGRLFDLGDGPQEPKTKPKASQAAEEPAEESEDRRLIREIRMELLALRNGLLHPPKIRKRLSGDASADEDE